MMEQEHRIPPALQAVFLASNRGKVIDCPPPNQVANKVFHPRASRGWSWKKTLSSRRYSNSRRSSFNTTQSNDSVGQSQGTPNRRFSSPLGSHQVSPHAYLGSMVLARGYSAKEYPSMEGAYYNEPTEFQKGSYGDTLISAIQKGDEETLRLLLVGGVSPNASNENGETIVHMVCRLGDLGCLQALVDFGCDLRVADRSGRTPLHEACRAANPSFEIVETIMTSDRRMFFITDEQGNTPLEYVPKMNWTPFTRFLMSKKDVFWPDRDFETLGEEEPPALTLEKPNSRPFLDGETEIPSGSSSRSRLARRGSAWGSPSCKMPNSTEDGSTEFSEYSEFSETENTTDGFEPTDSFHTSDFDFDDFSDSEFDEDEMHQILQSIGQKLPVQWCKDEDV